MYDVVLNTNINITDSKSVISISSSLSAGSRIDRSFSHFIRRMKQALKGTLDPAINVFSGDCGTGKSKAVQSLLAEWKAKGFPGDGSVIIFVNTLAEIDAYVAGAKLDHDDYAIATPDAKYKTYGAGLASANEVRILFATHAKARRVLSGEASFADAKEFLYRGKPRTLRIWDEAFLPVEYASFDLNDLRMLPGAFKGLGKTDIEVLENLLPDKDELLAGHIITVPLQVRDIADQALKSKMKVPERARQTLGALAKLAGATAMLTHSEAAGWYFVGTGLPMPADIAPLFVLDASARFSGRYRDWSACGMTITTLDPATVSYAPLAFHLWDKGCGKTVLRDKADRRVIFEAIADLINSKPEGTFLIVIAKEFCPIDDKEQLCLPDDLKRLLADPTKVQITTWGLHLGSNDFREAENVVLVGSYNYGDGAYDAISLAATGGGNRIVAKAERQATEAAEFMHNAYQAVCRVRVRHHHEGECQPANAYLIMGDTGRRRDQIRQAFPGCSISAWTPATSLTKKRKADTVLEAVIALLDTRSVVPFKLVIEECGSKQSSYLTKIVKQDRFRSMLRENGISMHGKFFLKRHIEKTAAQSSLPKKAA